jgi:hypothetical protein
LKQGRPATQAWCQLKRVDGMTNFLNRSLLVSTHTEERLFNI